MTVADLPAVAAISAAVHGNYAEPTEIYAERLALYPAGCFVWEDDGLHGLLVMHPWRRGASPALGAYLGTIPADGDTFYLHDIALLPETRGQGAGSAAMTLALALATDAGLSEISLVAVNGADGYWAAQGFSIVDSATGYGPGTYAMRRAVSR